MILQSSGMNNLETQRSFPECLSDKYLEELLNRVSLGKFKNDIENQFTNKPILQGITIKPRLSNGSNPDTSIYINFFNNHGKAFHISIHICPKIITPTSQQKLNRGALHIVQNNKQMQKHTQKIRVNRQNQNSLQFSVGTAVELGKNIHQNYKDLAQTALDVLTTYFTRGPSNKLHLSHKTTNQSHPLFQQYKQGRNNLLASYPKTRKTRRKRK
jgi:hypothetical protein